MLINALRPTGTKGLGTYLEEPSAEFQRGERLYRVTPLFLEYFVIQVFAIAGLQWLALN